MGTRLSQSCVVNVVFLSPEGDKRGSAASDGNGASDDDYDDDLAAVDLDSDGFYDGVRTPYTSHGSATDVEDAIGADLGSMTPGASDVESIHTVIPDDELSLPPPSSSPSDASDGPEIIDGEEVVPADVAEALGGVLAGHTGQG